MAKELPYFKFEPTEWDSGNIQMCSRESKGLFIDLCALYWNRLGELPYALALQKLCNGNKDALQELIDNEIIVVFEGNISIEFLEEQLSEFGDVSEKRRKAANKRWSNANALQEQSKSNAIREDNIIEDKIKGESIAHNPQSTPDLIDFFGVGLPMSRKEISNPEAMKIASRHYYTHGDKKYSKDIWDKYFEYWYAVQKNGKPLWMKQTTFSIPARIKRFENDNKQKQPSIYDSKYNKQRLNSN